MKTRLSSRCWKSAGAWISRDGSFIQHETKSSPRSHAPRRVWPGSFACQHRTGTRSSGCGISATPIVLQMSWVSQLREPGTCATRGNWNRSARTLPLQSNLQSKSISSTRQKPKHGGRVATLNYENSSNGQLHKSSMVVRRTRQHPPEFGRASTFVETIELPQLEELSERFLRAINYYGLVELEYKLDPRDGQYRLLDVNGRTWGYHTLGPGAGVDFPYLLFADQVGESLPPCRGRAGVSWVRLVTDVPTGVLEILKGRQNWRTYLWSLRHFDVEAVFSREDPLPGLVEIALLPYLSVKRGF